MADKNTGKQERPRVTISDKSRTALESIRDMLDQESEAATKEGETYAAGVITNLLDQVERTLARVNTYTSRTKVASRRKTIKEMRKGATTSGPTASTTSGASKSA